MWEHIRNWVSNSVHVTIVSGKVWSTGFPAYAQLKPGLFEKQNILHLCAGTTWETSILSYLFSQHQLSWPCFRTFNFTCVNRQIYWCFEFSGFGWLVEWHFYPCKMPIWKFILRDMNVSGCEIACIDIFKDVRSPNKIKLKQVTALHERKNIFSRSL